MIRSQTGSGKTLAYTVPVIQLLQAPAERLTRAGGTRAIILCPTRELVLQVIGVVEKVSRPFHWLVSTAIMGGERKKSGE